LKGKGRWAYTDIMSKMHLITGSSNPRMAKQIASVLKIRLTPVEIKRFADGEVYTRVKQKVRGDDVFIFQSFSRPVNDHLMELLVMIDALKRASAGRINVLSPYMAYSRQDRKVKSREPITAKLVADLLSKAGADRIITVDFHTDQLQGFYNIPVDHFVGYPQFAKYVKEKQYQNLVIVSPDVGGLKRANGMADLLGCSIAVIDKVRREHNRSEILQVVGKVKGKTAVLIDDIIDTAGSISLAATRVKEEGATEVIVCATHGLFSGNAAERLNNAPVSKVLLLDTVPLNKQIKIKKLEVISLVSLWTKIIKRIHKHQSLGKLFTWEDKRTFL